MSRERLVMFATLFAASCLCPLTASAHLNSTGMGPVYDGLLHFLVSPEDIVPVVALAMFAGLRGPDYGRRALFMLPTIWFVGCLFGTMVVLPTARPVAAVSFLVFGGLVAANAGLSLRTTTILVAALGLVHGILNGAGMRWSISLLGAYLGLVGRNFCCCNACVSLYHHIARALGTNRGASSRKLDCGDRTVIARVGSEARIDLDEQSKIAFRMVSIGLGVLHQGFIEGVFGAQVSGDHQVACAPVSANAFLWPVTGTCTIPRVTGHWPLYPGKIYNEQ